MWVMAPNMGGYHNTRAALVLGRDRSSGWGGTAVRDIQIFGMEGLGLEPASRTRSSPCPNIDVCSLVGSALPPERVRVVAPPLGTPFPVFADDDAETDTGAAITIIAGGPEFEHALAQFVPSF